MINKQRKHQTRIEGRGDIFDTKKYVGVCSCGWIGLMRDSPGIAEEDIENHEIINSEERE